MECRRRLHPYRKGVPTCGYAYIAVYPDKFSWKEGDRVVRPTDSRHASRNYTLNAGVHGRHEAPRRRFAPGMVQ
jgi:hypothetical protein